MIITKRTFTVSDSMAFDVRTVLRDGEPWFAAKDVAEILGYENPSEATRDHCKHVTVLRRCDVNNYAITSKSQGVLIPTRGMQIIPESDVYRLIMCSKLPTAELFQDWVCGEVLPSLRKNGSYAVPQAAPQTYVEALLEAARLAIEGVTHTEQFALASRKVIAHLA